MGGRGSNSKLGGGNTGTAPVPQPQPAPTPQPTPAPSPQITRAKDAQDWAQLRQYMYNTYGFKSANALGQMDFRTMKYVMSGIEDIINEFPQAKDSIRRIDDNITTAGAYACAGYDGHISLNPSMFNNGKSLARQYQSDLSSGFHPAGTKSGHIAVHEAGHLLEVALISKHLGHGSAAGAMAWATNQFSSQLVVNACNTLRALPGNAKKTDNDFIKEVSRYAMKNRAETLAECVADYYANGSNAKPLSQEMWKLIKQELG